MLSFRTDHHGWAELTQPRKASSHCQEKHRSAWAVVGAGFTGLSCARRLAQLHPKEQIILLDARVVGQGTSGRNSGFAVSTSQFHGPFKPELKSEYQRVNRINHTGQSLLRELVQAHNIDCDWHEDGFYHTAADKSSIKEYHYFVEHLERLEVAYTTLNQEQLAAKIGTDWYRHGVHVHNGALLHPAKLVHGLADNLPTNVKLYENSPVTSITAHKPIELQTPEATIRSDKVILAVNYEAAKLGFLQRRLIGSTLAGSFTRMLTAEERSLLGSQTAWGSLSLHNGGATLRLTPEGRINLRNTAEYHGGQLLSESALLRRQKVHRVAFEKRFPQLAHVPFEYAWSGVEGISANGTNFFLNPKPNLYLAGGYNGSGVSRGTAFGYAIADYANDENSGLVSDCLQSVSAKWLPPRPLLDIGAWFTVRSRFRGVGRDR